MLRAGRWVGAGAVAAAVVIAVACGSSVGSGQTGSDAGCPPRFDEAQNRLTLFHQPCAVGLLHEPFAEENSGDDTARLLQVIGFDLAGFQQIRLHYDRDALADEEWGYDPRTRRVRKTAYNPLTASAGLNYLTEDLIVALRAVDRPETGGRVELQVFVRPLVRAVWTGGLLISRGSARRGG